MKRAKNNKLAFETEPQGTIPKNEASGDIFVSYEEIQLDQIDSLTAGDVILCQELPAEAKVKSVRVINNEDIADGEITVGYSSNLELDDREEVVAADADAFLGATTLAAATPESAMDSDAVGFLFEPKRPVFLTVTFSTLPTVIDSKKLIILVETIGK